MNAVYYRVDSNAAALRRLKPSERLDENASQADNAAKVDELAEKYKHTSFFAAPLKELKRKRKRTRKRAKATPGPRAEAGISRAQTGTPAGEEEALPLSSGSDGEEWVSPSSEDEDISSPSDSENESAGLDPAVEPKESAAEPAELVAAEPAEPAEPAELAAEPTQPAELVELAAEPTEPEEQRGRRQTATAAARQDSQRVFEEVDDSGRVVSVQVLMEEMLPPWRAERDDVKSHFSLREKEAAEVRFFSKLRVGVWEAGAREDAPRGVEWGSDSSDSGSDDDGLVEWKQTLDFDLLRRGGFEQREDGGWAVRPGREIDAALVAGLSVGGGMLCDVQLAVLLPREIEKSQVWVKVGLLYDRDDLLELCSKSRVDNKLEQAAGFKVSKMWEDEVAEDMSVDAFWVPVGKIIDKHKVKYLEAAAAHPRRRGDKTVYCRNALSPHQVAAIRALKSSPALAKRRRLERLSDT
jgi:hypothetical protein